VTFALSMLVKLDALRPGDALRVEADVIRQRRNRQGVRNAAHAVL
jgi:hypothetical protein